MQDTEPTHILRIEGVNLSHVLDDTEDLSTRRGGGLHLLQAVPDLLSHPNALSQLPENASISTGASSGTFVVTGETGETSKLIGKLREHFRSGGYAHFTTVVDAVPWDGKACSFSKANEGAIAANRWQQMQSLSLAIPAVAGGGARSAHVMKRLWDSLKKSKTTDQGVQGACAIDALRPASNKEHLPGGKSAWVSASVAYRRALGRDARQRFYHRVLGAEAVRALGIDDSDRLVTDDLQQLAGNGPDDVGNLRDKIALIYMDGNGFGKVQRDASKIGAEALTEWDKHVKCLRRELLRDLLAAALHPCDANRWQTQVTRGQKTTSVLRLETLLWGGDEFLLVVPAWLGWPVLHFLFKRVASWEYEREPLTMAAGLVFAHAKSPIARLTLLAKNLSERGKAKDRFQNTVVWQSLESFDHTGMDLDRYFKRRFHDRFTWDAWVLTADAAQALDTAHGKLRDVIPRSQLIDAALLSLRLAPDVAQHERLKRALARIAGACNDGGASDLLHSTWNALAKIPKFPTSNADIANSPAAIAALVQWAEWWDYGGHEPLKVPSVDGGGRV